MNALAAAADQMAELLTEMLGTDLVPSELTAEVVDALSAYRAAR